LYRYGEVDLARRVSDGLLVAVKRVNLGALTDAKALTVGLGIKH
jgi:hypothetical protein